jgi:hypothetical protein
VSDDGHALILFDIPEDEISQFEFDEVGSPARQFAIPAEVLNRYPIVAVRQPPEQRQLTAPASSDASEPPPAAAPRRRRGAARRRRRRLALAALLALLAGGGIAAYAATRDDDGGNAQRASSSTNTGTTESAPTTAPAPAPPATKPTGSVAVGTPGHGRLIRGVAFPAAGPNHFTWDASTNSSPNPRSRRYSTDYVRRAVLRALGRYRKRNPGAPKVGIGDLSLRRGGAFETLSGGRDQGHQNGLDVTVLYPRSDGGETEPTAVEQVNRQLAQALLDELARAGAIRVTLDPRLGLTVPKGMSETTSSQPRMHVGFRKRK